jgi:L-iditol 2-dehydrogenase
MKALLLREYKQLEYTDFSAPEIGPNEVLLAVKATGICGSDVHGYDGSSGRRIPPIIMGHETAGVIVDTGAKVTGWKHGDRVTCDSTVYCGECFFCRRGEINLCENRRVLGVSTPQYRRHGAFAEYVAVPQHILYHLPEEVSFPQAAMLEPLSVAFHSVRITPLDVNDSALVVGSGMVGLLVIQALRIAGCGQIIALDLDQERIDQALLLGADSGLLSTDPDLREKIQSLTAGRGVDHGFEVVGITPAIRSAVENVRKGGTVTLVGNLNPTVELPLQVVVTGEITLYGSCASEGEYPACIEMLRRGRVSVESMISAIAPLKDGAAWFERLYQREPGLMKVILEP